MPQTSTTTDGRFTGLINPLQGTDSQPSLSFGNTLPLAAMPWGMTYWSPQTDEDAWFFRYSSPKVSGFRATHQPSPWMGDFGQFVVMPQTGPRLLTHDGRASSYRISDAIFQPHYQKLELLRYGITAELVPTERCALMRFAFGDASSGRLILQPGPKESMIRIDAEKRRIVGYTRAHAQGAPANFAAYFIVQLDRAISAFGLFQDKKAFENEATRTGERVGAYVEFDPSPGPVIARVSTSFIDLEQAERNLTLELGDQSLEALRDRGAATWNGILERVQIEGATDEQAKTFYSCLYRTALFPTSLHEPDANGNLRHYSPFDGQIHSGPMYTNNGFWDTYRTVYPLYSLLFPERLSQILQGYLNAYQQSGWFPKWPSPGHRGVMIGSHIDAVMADAVVKNISGFDYASVYEGLRKHAMTPPDKSDYGRANLDQYLKDGFVASETGKSNHGTSATLDYAYGDWCIAQIAAKLGKTDDAAMFLKRATNYRNVFDENVGFMRGKRADGAWMEPFNEFSWGGPFVEGSVWQCGWAVQHDIAGLTQLMGGRDKFIAKLDRMISLPPTFDATNYGGEIHEMTEMARVNFGQYAHSNQPSHHVPFLYAAAGQPWKTQALTRRVLSELYNSGPRGFAGDEDNGEMASWYVLCALGLYPLCPGHPSYVLTSPLFPKATLSLNEGGRTFVIEANRNSAQNVYSHAVQLNGKPHNATWITHDDVMTCNTLSMTMRGEPDDRRVDDAANLPYSMSEKR